MYSTWKQQVDSSKVSSHPRCSLQRGGAAYFQHKEENIITSQHHSTDCTILSALLTAWVYRFSYSCIRRAACGGQHSSTRGRGPGRGLGRITESHLLDVIPHGRGLAPSGRRQRPIQRGLLRITRNS
jgi:hypothetical protein